MRGICSRRSDLVANVKKLNDCFKEMVNKETKRVLGNSLFRCS